MNVLGLNTYLHDSSAALYQNGRLVFAIEEERLSRIKKDNRFPVHSVKAALEFGGIEMGDLDAIAFGWNRGGRTPMHTLSSVLTARRPLRPLTMVDSLVTGPRELYSVNGRRLLRRSFPSSEGRPILFVDHHLAHAWSTYALSGF